MCVAPTTAVGQQPTALADVAAPRAVVTTPAGALRIVATATGISGTGGQTITGG